VRLDVLMAVKIQVEVCWVLTPCSVVVGYLRFRGLWCLHLQGEVKIMMDAVFLRNVCIVPQHYTASQRREARPEFSSIIITAISEAAELFGDSTWASFVQNCYQKSSRVVTIH